DFEAAKAEADHVVRIERLHVDRFSSTPLECSGCLVEYNRGTGQWTMYCNHQMPGVGAIWMAPALRVGIDKLRFVTQDIGGAFGNKICLHPQFVACCLLARKLNRPIQWTEWRTDQHTANAHGNERTFLDVEVPVKADGTMLGFSVRAVDDCGAFPRYEPHGLVPHAERLDHGLRRLRPLHRHRPGADRLRPAPGAAARRRRARQAPRLRDRLDARLGDEQLRPVDAPEPGAPVLREQRGGDGE